MHADDAADSASSSQGSPFSPEEHELLREQLPAVRECAYFNAGFLGPLTQASIDAQLVQIVHERTQRITADWYERLLATQHQARSLLGRLTGADAAQVALMHSTTEALNAALWALAIGPGSNVITTDEEHPGLLVPLRLLHDRYGVEIRVVEIGDDVESLAERIADRCDSCTRAVGMSHVSWLTGRVLPIAEVRAAVDDRASDAALVVDGAQAAGALPVDIAALGADAYTVSGHKWPLSPAGAGALVVRDIDRFHPAWGGYGTPHDPDQPISSPLRNTAQRLEVTQEAFAPLAGLNASLEFLLDTVQVERAARHSRYLNRTLRDVLPSGTVNRGSCHVVTLNTPAGKAINVATDLSAQGFLVRSLPGRDLIRVSLGFWNTADEVSGLAGAYEGVTHSS